MATDLKVGTVLQGHIGLTQFWGGDDRGVCIQATQLDARARLDCCGYIQLTIEEAQALSAELAVWCLHRKLGVTQNGGGQ